MLLKRAVDVGYSFRLATEMESAAGFDDIVFKDEQNKKYVSLYKSNISKMNAKNRCRQIAFKDKSGEFSLAKYFVPYPKIKNNQDFADGDLKDFTICTNIGFDLAQRAIWFDVRGPVRLFTGRDEELGMLHDSLQRNPKGAVISYITSISGPGGMGKSQLARKYACKYRRYYDGNVIWIDAENFEAMKDSS
ncbi:NB-ARC domain-containing protein [Trichonephila clavipes]|nr:NB-ARC domain-containing protein [Trichonephila clavipes]